MPPSARLAGLESLLRRSGEIARSLRDENGRAFGSELKADGSIVTQADRRVEEMLRLELPRLVPGSTVWGEEYGFEAEGPGGLWVVDPVDGTSNFRYGSPLWGITAALVEGDAITVGGVFLPDLGEMVLAERGAGVTRNGEPVAPIPPGPIRPEELVDYSDGVLRKVGFGRVPGKMRLSGAFVIAGVFTATQRIRGMIGHKERLYDVGACVLMGQELGADVRYADGAPFDIGPLKSPEPIGRPWIIFPHDSGFLVAP